MNIESNKININLKKVGHWSVLISDRCYLKVKRKRTPPPSTNKAAHSGFETHRSHHQKSKTGVSVAPQKGLMSSKIFFKKSQELFYQISMYNLLLFQMFHSRCDLLCIIAEQRHIVRAVTFWQRSLSDYIQQTSCNITDLSSHRRISSFLIGFQILILDW